MDWDKNGMVNIKEFLFAFTRWVGIDDVEDEEGEETAWIQKLTGISVHVTYSRDLLVAVNPLYYKVNTNTQDQTLLSL